MKNKAINPFFEYIFVLTLLASIYFSGLNKVLFHPDESGWIATSSVFKAYFSGNFSSPLWKESYWTVIQPPLPRYLIGFGGWIGGLDDSELNKPWIFSKDFSTNRAEGRLPSDQLLFWSRIPMVFLAVISIFIGFMILNILAGKIPAYIWVGLCLISTYFLSMLRRAMGESPLLASIALILLITYKIFKLSEKDKLINLKQLFLYFLILGCVVGLAGSSKLNGFSAIAVGLILSIIIAFRIEQTKTIRIRFLILSILILILSSLFSFIAINPYLWSKPLNRTSRMVYQRLAEMDEQQVNYPESKIIGINNRIVILSNRIFQNYSAIDITGIFVVNLFFFFIGFAFLIIKSFQFLKNHHSNPASISILIVFITNSAPALITPLDWDRYYLIPIYFSTLFIAIGIWWSLLFIINSILKSRFLQNRIRV